jgi:hypothetical protein
MFKGMTKMIDCLERIATALERIAAVMLTNVPPTGGLTNVPPTGGKKARKTLEEKGVEGEDKTV